MKKRKLFFDFYNHLLSSLKSKNGLKLPPYIFFLLLRAGINHVSDSNTIDSLSGRRSSNLARKDKSKNDK
jgi:hypothetical protein